MEYEKKKISRLIDYKDKIVDDDIKNDLEWILEQYNNYFINTNEFDYQSKNYKKVLNKYYNCEDEKQRIKDELDLYKRKYKVLRKMYYELKDKYRLCCKNLKNMI